MALEFVYSGNLYNNSAAGTDTFALVSTSGNPIPYLQKNHIHVYLSTDDGATYVEQARPADWDFDVAGTSVVLTSAIAAGEWIKIQRITPYLDRYVTFQQGSLLTSDELNEGENFSMYVDQEIYDASLQIIGSKVTRVTGAAPIVVNNQDELNPVVQLNRITGAEATVDPTNPSWDTDQFIATPSATERLYANIVGDGAGYPGAGNLGKAGKLRIDNTGATPRFFFWDAAAATPTWVEVQTTGAQGPQGPAGPAPGLQNPATTVVNVPNEIDGTPGDATVTIDQDPGTLDLRFNFGVPVGETGPQGPQGPAGAGVTYLGPVDPTTVGPPAQLDNGDFFVVSTAGTAIGWPGLTTVAVNDRIIFNANTQVWDQFPAAGNVINLGYTAAANNGTVTNDSGGTDATLPLATQAEAGLLSPVDKTKLDGIATGAEVNVQADWNVGDTNSDAFIRNKPTIPPAQVQADWNETVNSDPSFIQNKPTIPPAPVNADWNASAGLAQILNKPTIPPAQVQADWDETNVGSASFILNKPAINLGYTTAANTGTVTNAAGTNATIPAATTSAAGLLTSTDKTKLDGIAPGAGTGTVTSIATSGAITGGTITTTGTITAREASVSQTGVVQLNNATDSTSTTQAATANAVRVAMNQANTATTNAATAQTTANTANTNAGNAQTTANTANTTANTANTTANAALARAGGTMTGGVYQTVRTIGNNSTWNMTTGNLWTFGGGTLANPSNATAGMTGVIWITGAVTGYGSNFSTNPTVAGNQVVPYYVTANNVIRLGLAVAGA